MNTLNIIKNHIEEMPDFMMLKYFTACRGVKYQAHQKNEATPHGTYTYRGSYLHQVNHGSITNCWDHIPRLCSMYVLDLWRDSSPSKVKLRGFDPLFLDL